LKLKCDVLLSKLGFKFNLRRYNELTALVCLARRPAEEEDDDSPGGGKDETGAKKLTGHLVSFLKVLPPYVDVRGQFAAAAYVAGWSPGVSPIPDGGMAAARAEAAAAAASISTTTSTSSAAAEVAAAAAGQELGAQAGGDPPATPAKESTASEGVDMTAEAAAEAAAAEAAAAVKAAQFAAAVKAGEAMYGGGGAQSFEGMPTPSTPVRTPAGAAGLSAAGTDWLLFNDFCINPVSPREVTMLYGQLKLPCLCMYTRVERPAPPPLPPSPITPDLYRRLTLDANLPPRCPFKPFDFETAADTPKAGAYTRPLCSST